MQRNQTNVHLFTNMYIILYTIWYIKSLFWSGLKWLCFCFSCCFGFFLCFFSTYRAMEAFIRSKYERKQYLKKDGLPPNKPTSTPATKETKSVDKVRNFYLNTFNPFKRVITCLKCIIWILGSTASQPGSSRTRSCEIQFCLKSVLAILTTRGVLNCQGFFPVSWRLLAVQ